MTVRRTGLPFFVAAIAITLPPLSVSATLSWIVTVQTASGRGCFSEKQKSAPNRSRCRSARKGSGAEFT